jgi:hypothetical protein
MPLRREQCFYDEACIEHQVARNEEPRLLEGVDAPRGGNPASGHVLPPADRSNEVDPHLGMRAFLVARSIALPRSSRDVVVARTTLAFFCAGLIFFGSPLSLSRIVPPSPTR